MSSITDSINAWAKNYTPGETIEIETTPKLRKQCSIIQEHKKSRKKRKKKKQSEQEKTLQRSCQRSTIDTESYVSEVEGSNFKSY